MLCYVILCCILYVMLCYVMIYYVVFYMLCYFRACVFVPSYCCTYSWILCEVHMFRPSDNAMYILLTDSSLLLVNNELLQKM